MIRWLINKYRKYKYPKIVHNAVLVFFVLNLVNSVEEIGVDFTSAKQLVYYVFHVLAVLVLFRNIYTDIKSENSFLRHLYNRFTKSKIPKTLRVIIVLIFIGQLIYISIGETRYPLSYVGMFSWSVDFSEAPTQVHLPKYYYYEDGEPQIVEIRKQHIFFMADLLGWGFNNELTFSMNYHYKGEKENFKFLKESLEDEGIDSLWVGLQTVDYKNQEVHFDPDIERATAYNDTASNIYYGPIYLPKYQRELYKND